MGCVFRNPESTHPGSFVYMHSVFVCFASQHSSYLHTVKMPGYDFGIPMHVFEATVQKTFQAKLGLTGWGWGVGSF